MSEGLNLDMIGNFGKIRLKGGLGWVGQNKLHFGRYPRLHFERKDPAPECHLGRDWAELKEYGSGEIFLFRIYLIYLKNHLLRYNSYAIYLSLFVTQPGFRS